MNAYVEKIFWSARGEFVVQYHLRDRLLKIKPNNTRLYVRAGNRLNEDDFTPRGLAIAQCFWRNDTGLASVQMQPYVLTVARAQAFSRSEVNKEVRRVLRATASGQVSFEESQPETTTPANQRRKVVKTPENVRPKAAVAATSAGNAPALTPATAAVSNPARQADVNPLEPIILPATQPHLQLRVYIVQYRGVWYLHVREWYSHKGEYRPSPKGVAVHLENVDRLVEALAMMKGCIPSLGGT